MSQAHYSDEDEDELPHRVTIENAWKCEKAGHIMEAILLYEESIFKLNHEDSLGPKKQELCQKYEAWVRHLRDQVTAHLQDSRILEHITIQQESRGHGYQSLLGAYLNDSVKEAHLNEPCLSEQHQFNNLVNFLEVLIRNCRYLKYIRLTTRSDVTQPRNQLHILQKICADLAEGNIHMNFQLDDTLNDRNIVLSSGIVIRIGRGLHYFEPPDHRYSLGLCDYDFRKCLETEVNIWKCRPFAKPLKEQPERRFYEPFSSMDDDNTYSTE